MSILSDAILNQLLSSGLPVIIVPSDYIFKEEDDDDEIDVPRLISSVIPSPSAG